MKVYNLLLRTSVTAAIVMVILLLTLAIILAVTIQSAVAALLAVSAISFTTGFMGAIGGMIWINRIRIRNPRFLAKAEAKAMESQSVIQATIIDENGVRGGGGNGTDTGLAFGTDGIYPNGISARSSRS
jgi:hypothetical protein